MARARYVPVSALMLECGICMDGFKEPRVLLCGHSFCLGCLTQYVGTATRFNCPYCKRQCAVPQGGVQDLSKNYVISDIRGIIEAEKVTGVTPSSAAKVKLGCVNREANDPHGDVVAFCCKCAEYYCKACDSSHHKYRATRSHETVPIDQLTEEQVREAKALVEIPMCDRHDSEKITLYCHTCKVSMCTVCHATKHKDHEIEDLADAAIKCKVVLDKSLMSASEYIKTVNLLKETLLQTKAKVKQDCQIARDRVARGTDELVRKAREQETQLIDQINKAEHHTLSSIDANLKMYDIQMDDVTSLVSVSDALDTNYDMLAMGGGTSQQLQNIQHKPLISTEWKMKATIQGVTTLNVTELVGNVTLRKRSDDDRGSKVVDGDKTRVRGEEKPALPDVPSAVIKLIEAGQLPVTTDCYTMRLTLNSL